MSVAWGRVSRRGRLGAACSIVSADEFIVRSISRVELALCGPDNSLRACAIVRRKRMASVYRSADEVLQSDN